MPCIPAIVLAGAMMAQAPVPPPPKRHPLLTIVEHLAIGAGTYAAVSGSANWRWYPGVIATGAVAGFKEGSDAVAGRDSKKMAVIHALEILAGAGIVAAVKRR